MLFHWPAHHLQESLWGPWISWPWWRIEQGYGVLSRECSGTVLPEFYSSGWFPGGCYPWWSSHVQLLLLKVWSESVSSCQAPTFLTTKRGLSVNFSWCFVPVNWVLALPICHQVSSSQKISYQALESSYPFGTFWDLHFIAQDSV